MRLMRRMTPEQHRAILSKYDSNVEAAAAYSKKMQAEVSRQLVRYWRHVFLQSKSKAAADRELRRNLELIKPLPDDDVGSETYVPKRAERILVIPDLHAPYHHRDALSFLRAVADAFAPDLVVNLGDELDGHALSFHESDPNLDSAGVEFEKAREAMQELNELFPHMLLCHSNHGSLVYRRAKAHGIPVQMIKTYREMLFPEGGGHGWSWRYAWRIRTQTGDVTFKHQASGQPLLDAAHTGTSLVTGHEHGNFDVQYAASSDRLYWAARAGCLIDNDSLAFAYGRHTRNKPILGCIVIVKGIPLQIPMILDKQGNWIKEIR